MKATVFSSFGQIDSQPFLILRQPGVPRPSPKHDSVFFEEPRQDLEAAVRLLKRQFVGDARPGLIAGAENRRRFENKRPVDDPQPR